MKEGFEDINLLCAERRSRVGSVGFSSLSGILRWHPTAVARARPRVG